MDRVERPAEDADLFQNGIGNDKSEKSATGRGFLFRAVNMKFRVTL
jgi:hypothetical protein